MFLPKIWEVGAPPKGRLRNGGLGGRLGRLGCDGDARAEIKTGTV